MSYLIEKSRFYKEGERYNSGEGLSSFKESKAEAEVLFEICAADRTQAREYSVTLTDTNTQKILRHVGPSQQRAASSMHRAYHKRQRETLQASA